MLGLGIWLSSCTPGQSTTASPGRPPQKRAAAAVAVRRDSLSLFDTARNRRVPVALYLPATAPRVRQKVALLNHGYGGTNTAYSFLAEQLVARGYFVASIQHELPGDEPIATTGNLYEARLPNWRRGVQNILFVVQELKRTRPELDYANLLLLGHSNGGDMVMLCAQEHPELVHTVISLDNRRVPLPRTRQPRILSLRSSDQPADAGVLPTPAEQEKWGIKVVRLPHTLHNDMWDGATATQKQEMTALISSFLASPVPAR